MKEVKLFKMRIFLVLSSFEKEELNTMNYKGSEVG
jgi:hypothetical protein